MPGIPVHHQLLKLSQTHVHQVGDATQPSHPLLLLSSTFPSIRVFSNELALSIRWPKYWRFSLSPSNEYSGLISFRIDWFDIPCSPRDLQESFPTPQCSTFFMVQLSHPYMTNRKTIAVTIQIFVGKVMSLLFNMLSKFVYL